jgi:branched-chain amino acid aminotransferase
MKAYKSLTDQSIRLFRPDMNMTRLAGSMDRLHMPGADFDHKQLIDCIAELAKVDQRWIPRGQGYSLYLRPTVIATHRVLGLAPPESLLLYCISSAVGPYYKSGFKPIRLTTNSDYVRAWPGGTGSSKVGGNYAPTMKPAAQAAKLGYSQVLWLFGESETINEVGAMNVFFVLVNKDTNRRELVTAPLTRGDILPGVTRDSILHLARSWGDDLDVSERFATMPEIAQAAKDGRLLEAFGSGTAAVVTPIDAIHYNGIDVQVPATGELTKRIWDELAGIQYGTRSGPLGWSQSIGDASTSPLNCYE